MQVVCRKDSWLVKVICKCRGLGFLRVEACRVQYDCETFVRIFI